MVWLIQNKLDEAIAEYKKAISINNSTSSYNNLGIAFSRKGLIKEALKVFISAVQADLNDIEIRFNLGISYGQNKMYQQSEKEFLIIIKSTPDLIKVHFNLALTYMRMGNIKRAMDELKETLRLNPQYKKVHKFLNK